MAAVLLGGPLGTTTAALAEARDAGRADDLFNGGKELMAQKDYAHACSLLAQSYELDPATGTLLALALCHEREGKLGSAFREYGEVVLRSKGEARPDREGAAREKVQSIEPRLSTLTIKLPAGPLHTSLEVRLNGKALDPALLGRPIPVDGGTQRIEALAPGKKTWQGEVRVAESIDAKTLSIPALENVPAVPRRLTPAAGELPATPHAEPRALERSVARDEHGSPGLSTAQWIGLGTMGASVLALGAGTYFALRAIAKNDDSKAGCDADLCTPAARQTRLDARAAGNVASLAFITGGALAGVGLVIFLTGAHSAPSEAPPRSAIAAAPWAEPHALGATFHGSF